MVCTTEIGDIATERHFVGERRILSLGPIPKKILGMPGIGVDIAYNLNDFSTRIGTAGSLHDRYSAIVVMSDKPCARKALLDINDLYLTQGSGMPPVYVVGSKEIGVDLMDCRFQYVEGFDQLEDRLTDMSSLLITSQQDTRPRVLVVNDDPDYLKRIALLLQNNDCYVETADTGGGLVGRVIEGNFDVVILEKIISDMNTKVVYDAPDLSAKISEAAEKVGLDTKIILATDFLGSKDVRNYRNTGVIDLMAKPISAEQILATINEIVIGSKKPAKRVEKRENVLVVDDYSGIPEMIVDMLSLAGFTNPYATTNIVEATQILDSQKDKIDVVIADWGLLGIDEFLDKARAYGKAVVLLSGYRQEYILQKYTTEVDFLSKFDVFLQKPFETTKLLKTVQSLSDENSLLKVPIIRARNERERGEIIIVTGTYTAGKNTACELCSRLIPSLESYIRPTTREIRLSEDPKNFLTEQEFMRQVPPEYRYPLGGREYSSFVPVPFDRDYLVPTGLVGLKEMIKHYPNAPIVYLAISSDALVERLEKRPESEAWRYRDGGECIRQFDQYFPIGLGDRQFDRIIITEPLSSLQTVQERFSSIRKTALSLMRYIATLRN